jgi:hypothetical protein
MLQLDSATLGILVCGPKADGSRVCRQYSTAEGRVERNGTEWNLGGLCVTPHRLSGSPGPLAGIPRDKLELNH